VRFCTLNPETFDIARVSELQFFAFLEQLPPKLPPISENRSQFHIYAAVMEW